MKDIIKNKERQFEIERFAIDEIAKRTEGFLDASIIEERISKHLRRGIYLVSREEIETVDNDKAVTGMYNNGLGIILLDEQWFKKAPDVAIHEAAHAYLNSENKVKITVNDQEIGYGVGLEEGAVSILQKIGSFDDIADCVTDSYIYQAHLFKQLNELYKYSSGKKYSNLLEHLLNEPSKFLPTIFEIYNNILNTTTLEKSDILNLSYRCAGAIVMSTDAITDNVEADCHELFTICSCMNSVFLAIVDPKIRDEEAEHSLFPKFKQSYRTAEEKLLGMLFGHESLDGYHMRQKDVLNLCLTMYTNEMDKVDSNTIDYSNLKIKMK